MLQCDLTFFEKVQPKQNGRQGDDQPLPAKDSTKSCSVSASDYQLIFFNDEKQPFYRIDVGGLQTELDPSSKSLTLSKKKKGAILKISSDLEVLEKLEKYCKEFSDESILWSPLVYRPSSVTVIQSNDEDKKPLNLKGALVLAIIVVFYAKLEDVVRNIQDNGILPVSLSKFDPSMILYALTWVAIATPIMILFEKLAFKKILSNRFVGIIQAICVAINYTVPMFYIRSHKPETFYASIYVFWSLMVIMKMISYMHFMHNVRKILPKIKDAQTKRTDESKESLIKYISKENLEIVIRHLDDPSKLVSFKDVLQLYCFPTFIYQLWYPRTSKIDWKAVTNLSIKLILASVASFFWTNQFMIPALREASEMFRTGSGMDQITSLLRLTNNFAVLMPLNTYLILHLFPYLLAEVTRFEERDFYQDWWNSPNITAFWSRWNRVVHKWCQRHVYFLQSRGFSKLAGLSAVFLFSSFMHEYLLSVPYGIFTCYALGMMSQVIIIMMEVKFHKSSHQSSKIGFFLFAGLGLMLCCLAMIQYHVKQFNVHGASNSL